MDLNMMQLAAKLLDMAADNFSNHGSNDMDQSLFASLTDDQKIAMAGAFYAHNGDVEMIRDFEEADRPGKLKYFRWIGDSSWMSFCAAQLKEGTVVLSFPVEILPHFTINKPVFRADTPEEIAVAIADGIKASPVGEVSLKVLK